MITHSLNHRSIRVTSFEPIIFVKTKIRRGLDARGREYAMPCIFVHFLPVPLTSADIEGQLVTLRQYIPQLLKLLEERKHYEIHIRRSFDA